MSLLETGVSASLGSQFRAHTAVRYARPSPEEDCMSVRALPRPVHPVLQHHEEHRSQNIQNRIADAITTFAGSMVFVYLHILLFAVWMIVLEKKPWPTLTLVVSL